MVMARLTPPDIAGLRWTLAGFLALWMAMAAVASLLPPQALNFPYYRTAHVAAVQLVIGLNSLIFWLAWQRSKQDRDWRTVLLALAFLCATCFDLLYLLRLPGTQHLLPQTNPHDAVYFWKIARLSSCAGLYLMVALHFTRIEARRKVWLATALALLFVLFCALMVVLNWRGLPSLESASAGAALAAGLALLACLLAWCREQDNPPSATLPTLGRCALLGVSLALLLAQLHFHFLQFDNALNLLGPCFHVLASLLLCIALLQGQLTIPWRKPAPPQSTYERIAEQAADAILMTDARHCIVYANPAAAALFGRTPASLRGAAFATCIPRRFQQCYLSYLDRSGDFPSAPDGCSVRLRHEATGLRAGGEEFAMEVSLSMTSHLDQRCAIMLLRDVSERRSAQRVLQKSRDELRLLAQHLQEDREQERIRLSRYLTEDLSQMLAALLLELSLARQPLQDEAARRQHFLKMEEVLGLTIQAARRTSSALRPRSLEDGGLYFALQNLCHDFGVQHDILCEFQAHEHELQMDETRTTALFRIVEKALEAIGRQTQASEVQVSLQRHNDKLLLQVRDNGGLPRQEQFHEAIKICLAEMDERVKTLHGQLRMEHQPDASTRIEIAIPL